MKRSYTVKALLFGAASVALVAAGCVSEQNPSNETERSALLLSGDEIVSPQPAPADIQRTWTNERYVEQSNPSAHERHVFDLNLPSTGDGPFP